MNQEILFRALDDPTRRVMLDLLAERGEMTQYELCARLIMQHTVAMTRQAIAKHIDVLVEAGLVSSEKRGKFRLLVFTPEPLRTATARWLAQEPTEAT